MFRFTALLMVWALTRECRKPFLTAMLHRLPAIFLLLPILAPAQPMTGPQAASQDGAAIHSLEGTVINTLTGLPVPFALVEVHGRANLAMLTESDGKFSFGKLPEGVVQVTVRKPGFHPPGAGEYNRVFNAVTVGPKAAKVELRLVPESAIFGQVADRDGNPVEGATIEVVESRISEGRRYLAPQLGAGVVSDADGNFRVAGLTAGRYYLAVSAGAIMRRALGAQSGNGAETYPALIYFPSAPDIAGATPIDLRAGQRERAVFVLDRVPGFRLAGVVSDVSSYKQVVAPGIVDEAGRELFAANNWDPGTGKFEFSALPAGTHRLQVITIGADGGAAQQRKTIVLERNLTDVTIIPEPGLTIPVVVRVELGPNPGPHSCSGSFATHQGETVDCSLITAMVSLQSTEPAGPLPGQEPGARPISGNDPSLELRGVVPGRYTVKVTPMVAAHVHSIRCGGVDLRREPLIVPPVGQVPPIEVVLRDDGGNVTIHVSSDKPVGTGHILMFPEFAPNESPVNMDIRTMGNRAFRGLAPGNYKVFAFDSIDGIEYRNPEVMAKYNSKAATVTVTAGENAAVTVELIHTGD